MYDRLSVIEALETYIPQDRPTIDFDTIYPPCNILNLLTVQDIMELNKICKNRRLAGNPKEKQNRIKQIMMNRGFKKLAAGTNRLVFKYMEDQSFVIKVPFNSVGLRDNLDELYNQQFLKPFCTKVFQVSPCGTVGMFERVHGIKNREEFQLFSSLIFDIIINKFIGQFVLADFGTKFFMNWGIRRDAYPVLLDFPYLYELDGAKLYCNRPDPLSEHGFCGGEIDYDSGFNHLICKKCGKTYLASELRLSENKKTKSILIEREDIGMIVTLSRGDEVELRVDTSRESDTYRRNKKNKRRKETPLEYRERNRCKGFKVSIEEVDTNDLSTNEDIEEQNPTTGQPTPTIDEFNHNYSLDSIPNDINQVYRMTATVTSREDRRKKNDIKNITKESKSKKKETDIEVVEPISREIYEVTQQIHEVNAQQEQSVDVNEPIDENKDIVESVVIEKPTEAQEEINDTSSIPIGIDFDQDCNTNLSEILKDAANDIDLTEVPDRPATAAVIIQPRDEDYDDLDENTPVHTTTDETCREVSSQHLMDNDIQFDSIDSAFYD